MAKKKVTKTRNETAKVEKVVKPKTETCATKGCRRKAVEDGLCKKCLASIIPDDKVCKLTDTEAEYWGRLHAELRNATQAAQLVAYQQRELEADFKRRQAALEHKRLEYVQEATRVKSEYDPYTQGLCTKYGVEMQYAVIDVESRKIREEKPK